MYRKNKACWDPRNPYFLMAIGAGTVMSLESFTGQNFETHSTPPRSAISISIHIRILCCRKFSVPNVRRLCNRSVIFCPMHKYVIISYYKEIIRTVGFDYFTYILISLPMPTPPQIFSSKISISTRNPLHVHTRTVRVTHSTKGSRRHLLHTWSIRTSVDMQLFWLGKPLHNACVINISEQQNVITMVKWRHRTGFNCNFKHWFIAQSTRYFFRKKVTNMTSGTCWIFWHTIWV